MLLVELSIGTIHHAESQKSETESRSQKPVSPETILDGVLTSMSKSSSIHMAITESNRHLKISITRAS